MTSGTLIILHYIMDWGARLEAIIWVCRMRLDCGTLGNQCDLKVLEVPSGILLSGVWLVISMVICLSVINFIASPVLPRSVSWGADPS